MEVIEKPLTTTAYRGERTLVGMLDNWVSLPISVLVAFACVQGSVIF